MIIGLNYLESDEQVTQKFSQNAVYPFKSVKAAVAQSSIKK